MKKGVLFRNTVVYRLFYEWNQTQPRGTEVMIPCTWETSMTSHQYNLTWDPISLRFAAKIKKSPLMERIHIPQWSFPGGYYGWSSPPKPTNKSKVAPVPEALQDCSVVGSNNGWSKVLTSHRNVHSLHPPAPAGKNQCWVLRTRFCDPEIVVGSPTWETGRNFLKRCRHLGVNSADTSENHL